MKKFLVVAVLAFGFLMPFTVQAKGGVAPCLATCFMGDTRIGLAMNDGKPIETLDWINLFGSLITSAGSPTTTNSSSGSSFSSGNPTLSTIGMVARIYTSYSSGYQSSGIKGFCVSYLWGPRPGRMFKTHRLRTLEILRCVPLVCIYPAIAIPCEAYRGKTLTEVIETENLKR